MKLYLDMATAGVEYEKFWRDIVGAVAFFSPAVNPIQKEFGISSKELMRRLGVEMGRKASESIKAENLRAVFSHLSDVWRRLVLGRLEVISETPLVIRISDCTICGQIPELGRLFECSFHEGFFAGLLSHRLGRNVKVWQEGEMSGESGTWTRVYRFDASIE
ncbi:hypothetical protein HRbin01_01736 [archaeon HR01]|nr:hypothetical protein HRbin01_01736 [archaeon HR01]